MLKQRARIVATSVLLLDVSAVAVGFLLAYWLRDSVIPELRLGSISGRLYPLADSYLRLLPLALGVWAGCLLLTGRYRSARTLPLADEARGLLRASFLGTGLFAVALFALRLDPQLQISRLWLLLFGSLSALLLIAERLSLRLASRTLRAHGYNYRTILIVGANSDGRAIAHSIERHAFWGFHLLGFIATDDEETATDGSLPILGGIGELPRIIQANVVDEVIFAVNRRELDQMEDVFLSLEEQGIRTRFSLNVFPHARAKAELEDLDGLPLLTFSTAPANQLLLLLKRGMDVALAGLVLIVGLPLTAMIGLLIRVTSRGSVLFRQTRCGLNGRRFTLYKFRTMVADAEARRQDLAHLNEMDGPVFKLRDDPRVTRLGRLLRKFSLDELPQLWNVLRGDMSLVGPRPPIPEEVARYERWQRRRLSMKPGLTCLWQISGRNEVDFDRWMALDLEYIDSWSPLLDLKILLKTIPVVLSGKGAS